MRKEWTAEEIDFLQDQIGVYKITTIAKKMNRSRNSVIMKINRLGLSNTKKETGLLTIGELARQIKVDRNTVKGWVEKHGLQCTRKIPRDAKRFYFVDPADFWKWAEVHKDKVSFSKIEPYSILPEPSWVENERQKDLEITKKRAYRNWTIEEDKRLLEYKNQGFTYKEIGQIMNRSTHSIEHRFKRMNWMKEVEVN